MNIEEFKEKLGKDFSEITLEDIKNITADNEMLNVLNDYKVGLEISTDVIKENKNQEVIDEFTPLVYHHELYGAQKELGKMFAQYNEDNDKEKLVLSLNTFLKSAAPLGKISGYLIALNGIDGYDITLEDIQKAVDDSEDILFKMKIDRGFPIICDIIDILYTIQEEYYKKYKFDLIGENSKKLNNLITELDKLTQTMYENTQKQIENELPDDVKPEDLGMLDITRFKKENTNEKEE